MSARSHVSIEIESSRIKALPRKPRLGFVGVGWIGKHRMEAVCESGCADVACLVEPDDGMRELACASVPDAQVAGSLEELLTLDLDGVVIATPSALHASQSIAALERGLAVFCQKPLGRNGDETQRVVDAARAADRLLAVDLSYRCTRALRVLRELVQSGELGDVFAVDMTFHNAYGPDKPWFYQRGASGGGCVMDLGIHLVDALMWVLGFPEVRDVSSRLFQGGAPWRGLARAGGVDGGVEDYATARIDLAPGVVAQLACSWRLPAGRDAVIELRFYGTRGGAALSNVAGSFYDFTLDRFAGTQAERLVTPPDPWGGRAAVAFVERLRSDAGFDPRAHELVDVARILDAIYADS